MIEPNRIRVPRRPQAGDDAKTIDRLTEGGPFQTKQKALMFAAALGYHAGRRVPFASADEPIRWDVFERAGDDPFLAVLAVAVGGGLDILADETDDDAVAVFEEYANGGLAELEERVLNSPTDVLDELLRLLTSVRNAEGERPKGLEGISADQLDAIGLGS